MKGRKPKPWEVKVIEGTARADRAPDRFPPPTSGGSLHCPKSFDDEERGAWRRLCRAYREAGRSIRPEEYDIHVTYVILGVQLMRARRELGVLEAEMAERVAQLDLPGIDAGWAQAPSRMEQRRDRILRRLRQLGQEQKSIAAELGLTPSSRSRAGWGSSGGSSRSPADPWALFANPEEGPKT